jgi:hypothetical protein
MRGIGWLVVILAPPADTTKLAAGIKKLKATRIKLQQLQPRNEK